MIEETPKGKYSEWNEGDYKNLRLHQAQEIINRSQINPLIKISVDESGIRKYGYEFWYAGINILFGEGMQKYNQTEYDEVTKLRDEIEKLIDETDICKITEGIKNRTTCINIDNWKTLRKKLREFEHKVKHYNDEHGLSTRNKTDYDDGL